MLTLDKQICVYLHINPVKQEIFYVGIGLKKRPYCENNRNKYWKNTVNKYGYEVVIIHDNLSWQEASLLEKEYIKQFGRRDLEEGTLVNMTDGGEGGYNMSRESIERGRLKRSGQKRTQECRNRLSLSHIGKPSNMKGKSHSAASKLKISEMKKTQVKPLTFVILKYNLNNEFITSYATYREALESVNVFRNNSQISNVFKGLNSSYKGFIWKKGDLEC